MKYITTVYSFLKTSFSLQRRFHTYIRNCASQSSVTNGKKIDTLYQNPEVQKILKKITGFDYEKIFFPRKQKIVPYRYVFATEKRLKKLQDKVATKAVEKLQMPPVMEIRQPISEVLSKDPDLQGYLKHKTVFTDISPNISNRDRVITVRETDGTLRKASWEERQRMNQIFFPIPGRELDTPKLFESPYLERLLDEGSYVFVLDCVCVQFEPDDPEYHKVTNTTYEHINQMKKFDVLRSTRHFGPMAFYFAYKKNIDTLIIDMIEEQLISDASDTIKLLSILHPDLNISSTSDTANELEVVQDYIKNVATQKGNLELVFQTYLELQQSNLQKEEASL